MKTLTLTPKQRHMMLAELSTRRDDEHIDFSYEFEDGTSIEVYGNVYLEGYREPETGGYIETSRDVTIDVTLFDAEGNQYSADSATEDAVRDCLSELSPCFKLSYAC